MKKSDIKITVGLDENNVPDKLLWTAQDGGIEQEAAEAIFSSNPCSDGRYFSACNCRRENVGYDA